MTQYLRTTTVWAFAAGLTLGSLSIAAADAIGSAGAEQIPSCESVISHVSVAP